MDLNLLACNLCVYGLLIAAIRKPEDGLFKTFFIEWLLP